MYPRDFQVSAGPPRTPTSRLIRSYLKTILSNPESRKIFYFLMLNMSYMLVQMLYGVWTNSLGLISDGESSPTFSHLWNWSWISLSLQAIHMAFDCMAIGVGLFASVMATWAPNERFTYGFVALSWYSLNGGVLSGCLFQLWTNRDLIRICQWLISDFDINLHCIWSYPTPVSFLYAGIYA